MQCNECNGEQFEGEEAQSGVDDGDSAKDDSSGVHYREALLRAARI